MVHHQLCQQTQQGGADDPHLTSGHGGQKWAGQFQKGGAPTATTRLIIHRISKGETIASSLKDRLDYGKDPDKTQGGQLLSSYECDHMTADAEFLLSKERYKAATGREQKRDADVLCYQIRQSFKPGEITPEEANRIGYETAMRWTKGRHAFFVATHTDRAHIHNHIYYNSIALDCTRKYRNFLGSSFALRRLSDRVCIENDLSIIERPKLHSKGQFLHYGAWLGTDRQPSYKARLRSAIVAALQKGPADFDHFLRLMEEAGNAVQHGRGGVISFFAPGQESPTRLRASTLGPGFNPEDIRAVIAGERPLPELTEEAPAPRRVNLIIDIQERLRSGKGPGYERWAKVYNLKQMAAALQFLQEQGLTEYAQLAARTEAAVDRFHALAGELRETEAALAKTGELMGAVVRYAKTRPVFDGYKAARYSKKYLAEHEAELADYRAAKATMNELLAGGKLPKMDTLKRSHRELTER
ncbi:MAG: relaxase/mobilization nuclease domain-containing protein, partial [Clostridia bacterium]|nr:relaxase/mobilization nuclease domain-containing protein [Clostridia bacterium]